MNLYVDLIRVYSPVADCLLCLPYLLIQELPSVLLYVPLIQVCGQTHQTHLREAEVCELYVTHRGNQEAENRYANIQATQAHTSSFLNVHCNVLLKGYLVLLVRLEVTVYYAIVV